MFEWIKTRKPNKLNKMKETMIKIEIKNRWTGSIIFEYSKENNTIKDKIRKIILCNKII